MKKRLFIGLIIALVLVFALQTRDVQATNGGLKLYGIIGLNLVEVNTSDGDATLVANLSGLMDSVSAIAFDTNTCTLYGLARSGGNHKPKLATIDISTGVVTVIGDITLTGHTVYFAEGLAIAPDGTIYVSMSINGDFSPGSDWYSETLATVNPITAVATAIGTISPTVHTEADGLEFVGNTLYATDDPGSGPTNIYTINPGSAAASFMGTLSSPHFKNVNDMAYNPTSGLLYGFDPGVYANVYSRYLCTISQPGTAAATPIGITHDSKTEFGGTPAIPVYMGGLAWASEVCCDPFVTDLIAGAGQNDITKGTNVGNVTVTNDSDNLYVTYKITSANCYLTEVNLYVGDDPPTTAKPGKFPYKKEFIDNLTEWTFTIPLDDFDADCGDLYIAAHAVVCCDNDFLECETAWGNEGDTGDTLISLGITKKWGWFFVYTICCD